MRAAYNLFGVIAEDDGNTSGGDPVADYTETGPVTGENDLKPATAAVSPLVPTGGTVALKASSTGIKVWKSLSKGADNAVLTSGTEKTWDLSNQSQRDEFNAARSNLRVEGCTDGTVNLTLEYHIGSSTLSDMVKYTFIAATCDRQPMPDRRTFFASAFPNLVHCEWSITAPATLVYNCIAWSVGETTKWYNKSDIDGDPKYGNNDGVVQDSEMDAFYLDKRGWTPIDPMPPDPRDAEAMYYDGFHGAKKMGCSCGASKWIMFESKCGPQERIEHVWNQLNGTTYGAPVRFYK